MRLAQQLKIKHIRYAKAIRNGDDGESKRLLTKEKVYNVWRTSVT